MLTGKLVRVRHARNRLLPQYLDPANEGWLGLAEELLLAYRSAAGVRSHRVRYSPGRSSSIRRYAHACVTR